MDIFLYIGLTTTLVGIVALSIWSGTRKQQRKLSCPVVAGVIMGTLVGGSSSIGTAQLAWQYGMSAWWFTLGAGIACLILALCYVRPLRRTGCTTLVGIIRREYGDRTGIWVSVLSAAGTFINVIPQLISASAVITVVLPGMGTEAAVGISVLFMILYVIFGGTKGTGVAGIVKMVLLYLTMLTCGILVLKLTGGIGGFLTMSKTIPGDIPIFSLFARGISTDGGACLSLILGVLTTQTYAQAILSGKSDRDAVGGALVSTFLIPPIGMGGILVGLYMRANAALYQGVTAKTALTAFVITHTPPLLSGIILGALLVTVIAAGAGLALGVASIVHNDIVKRLFPRIEGTKREGLLSRIWIVAILAIAGLLSCGALGDTILQFAFMSMGLRGAVVFAPLFCALWLPGRISKNYATAAVIAGPLVVLIFGIWKVLPIDSLFLGTGTAIAIMAAGLLRGAHSRKRSTL